MAGLRNHLVKSRLKLANILCKYSFSAYSKCVVKFLNTKAGFKRLFYVADRGAENRFFGFCFLPLQVSG